MAFPGLDIRPEGFAVVGLAAFFTGVVRAPLTRGRYRLDRLIEPYGINAKRFEWSDEITADCPRKLARTSTTSAGLGARTCRRSCDVGGARDRRGGGTKVT